MMRETRLPVPLSEEDDGVNNAKTEGEKLETLPFPVFSPSVFTARACRSTFLKNVLRHARFVCGITRFAARPFLLPGGGVQKLRRVQPTLDLSEGQTAFALGVAIRFPPVCVGDVLISQKQRPVSAARLIEK